MIMRQGHSLAIRLLWGAALLTGAATAQAQSPSKKDVSIYGFISGGTGCPGKSSAKIVTNSLPGSTGADYFQVVFDAFTVEFGPDKSRRMRTKNCNFTFNVKYPKGYKFHFDTLEFDGYAELDPLVSARFDSRIRAPFGERIDYQTFLVGEYEGDFGEAETKDKLKTFKTDCSGEAMIKVETTIRIRGDKRRKGIVTVDAASGLLSQAYRTSWRRCQPWEM